MSATTRRSRITASASSNTAAHRSPVHAPATQPPPHTEPAHIHTTPHVHTTPAPRSCPRAARTGPVRAAHRGDRAPARSCARRQFDTQSALRGRCGRMRRVGAREFRLRRRSGSAPLQVRTQRHVCSTGERTKLPLRFVFAFVAIFIAGAGRTLGQEQNRLGDWVMARNCA